MTATEGPGRPAKAGSQLLGGPPRWAALTGLTLVPVFVGKALYYPTSTLNEWQVVAAMAIGAAAGGLLLALAWSAARGNHPILDVWGRRGVFPLAALWMLWAAVMGMMNALWIGEVLSVVLPGPPVVWTLALGAAAAALALWWRAGHGVAVLALAVLTAAAAMAVAPHVAAASAPLRWRSADGQCLGCIGPLPTSTAPPLAPAWPYFWQMLVNTAALTAAAVLTWVPVMGVGGGGRGSETRWRPLTAAAAVTVLAFLLVWAGQSVFASVIPSNPASGLLRLSGPGPWRDLLVAAITGGAWLWLTTVWAAGPPTLALSESVKGWLAGLAAAAALAGAWALDPFFPPLPQAYRLYGVRRVFSINFAQSDAGLRLLGAAYLTAPLIVVLALAWAIEAWAPCRRWGLRPLSGGVAAIIWGLAVAVSTRWMTGFGQFTAGPLLNRLAPSFTRDSNLLANADWALAMGVGAALVLYIAAAGIAHRAAVARVRYARRESLRAKV